MKRFSKTTLAICWFGGIPAAIVAGMLLPELGELILLIYAIVFWILPAVGLVVVCGIDIILGLIGGSGGDYGEGRLVILVCEDNPSSAAMVGMAWYRAFLLRIFICPYT